MMIVRMKLRLSETLSKGARGQFRETILADSPLLSIPPPTFRSLVPPSSRIPPLLLSADPSPPYPICRFIPLLSIKLGFIKP